MNGDLVDGQEGLKPELYEKFKPLSVPIYFTGGNHEDSVGLKEVEQQLRENGVIVLNNEIVTMKGIQLLGLNYMNADEDAYDPHDSGNSETIKSTLEKLKQDKPIVIAHHSPVGVKYMQAAGADIVLAGHTHAGQLFPAAIVAPFMFEYLKGLYDLGGTKVYVSEGMGTFGPPLRVLTESENTLIKLVPAP